MLYIKQLHSFFSGPAVQFPNDGLEPEETAHVTNQNVERFNPLKKA
jgi:hypothetical protein